MPDPRRFDAATATAVATIVRQGCLEYVRNRWLAMTVVAMAIALGCGQFTAALALAEVDAMRIAIVLPLLRVLASLIVVVLVVGAFAREAADRSRQLALAASISRPTWLAARFAAGGLLALATALAMSLAAAAVVLPSLSDPGALPGAAAGPPAVADGVHRLSALVAWATTLSGELLIVAAIASAVSLALAQPAAAILASLAVVVAGRAIGVILALDARTADAEPLPIDAATSAVLQGIATILPRLDQFARTDWLLGTAPPAVAGPLLQTLLYVALAYTVALIDLRRHEP